MKIAIIHYSMYGHVATMSESIKKGVLSADPSIQCDIYQVPETLSEEVLAAMHAPPKGDYPVITKEKMTDYDGFLFGIPGRFGMMPAQMRVRVLFLTVCAFPKQHFPGMSHCLICCLHRKHYNMNIVGIHGHDGRTLVHGCFGR